MTGDIDKLIASVDAAAKLKVGFADPWHVFHAETNGVCLEGDIETQICDTGDERDEWTLPAAKLIVATHNLDLHAIISALKRVKELENDVAERLADAFHEIASEEGGGVMKGWWCSNGRSTAVGYGDRLVEMGRYERSPNGHGRVRWYRPVSGGAITKDVKP